MRAVPISRILYAARRQRGGHLSVRPEPGTPNAASNGLSPIWSCCGRGLPCGAVLTGTRRALTPPFHPYRNRSSGGIFLLRYPFSGILSAASFFSKGLPALCSPDFPPRRTGATARAATPLFNIDEKTYYSSFFRQRIQIFSGLFSVSGTAIPEPWHRAGRIRRNPPIFPARRRPVFPADKCRHNVYNSMPFPAAIISGRQYSIPRR